MKFEAGKTILFLRYSNYRSKDFILEHEKLLNDRGEVWFLKVGKRIPNEKAEMVLRDGGNLVLRGPKSQGSSYYRAKIVDIHNGEPLSKMVFPQYYYDLIHDDVFWATDSLEGTWFKITEIERINPVIISHLKLVSNDRDIEDVINSTRSSIMYLYSDIDA